MNSLAKVPPYSKLNFQGKQFFTQNWCNITLILDKLKYKTNWVSEFTCLKKAIPNEWYHTLQTQISIKSVVNFQKDKFIVNGKCIDLSQLSNKYFYNEYILM